MYLNCWIFMLCIFLVGKGILSDEHVREKRCIVVQKQSGTHGDSTEGEEERRPEIKERGPGTKRRPDRRRGVDSDGIKSRDVEEFQPDLLKYKVLPTKQLNDVLRLRKRFYG